MTKEWQEATNEYLKVRYNDPFDLHASYAVLATMTNASFSHRQRNPTPSTVSAARDTAGRVMYKASRRRSSEEEVQQKLIGWCEGGKGGRGAFYWPARQEADVVVAGLALVFCSARAEAAAAADTVQLCLQERRSYQASLFIVNMELASDAVFKCRAKDAVSSEFPSLCEQRGW
jgi:hypothetical protein